MRPWAVRTWWALGLGLILCGSLEAQESRGNWFTRLFAWPTASAKKDAAPAKTVSVSSKTSETPVAAPVAQAKSAQAEYLRRMEACDKLREIALAKNDPELMRQADQLEQRSWDLFVQSSQRSAEGPSLDEVVLQKSLKTEPTEPRRLLSIPTVFGSRGETKNGIAARKE